MPKVTDPNGKELTRQKMIGALLRRIVAYTIVLKRQLNEEDYEALKTLRPFLKATDALMAEIGCQDKM